MLIKAKIDNKNCEIEVEGSIIDIASGLAVIINNIASDFSKQSKLPKKLLIDMVIESLNFSMDNL